MAFAVIDFETRSACDLKKCGAWVYSEHPTTEVVCLSYCLNDDEPRLWNAHVPKYDTQPPDSPPQDLFDAIASGAWIVAHNALFERGIWRNVMERQWGWPAVPDEQWYDTMATCGRRQLPLDLDQATRLLRLNFQKNSEGHQAMMKICKPMGKKQEFNEDPELYNTVYGYCEDDIHAERALLQRLRIVEKNELRIWRLNQRMNLRGLQLDMKFVADCQAVIDKAMPGIKKEFETLVGCKAGSHVKVREWINERTPSPKFPDLKGETVEDALEHRDDLPREVIHALRLKMQATSTSISKLEAMRNCVSADGRARGLLQYHGAGPGRDAGRLIQPQNFPRGVVEGGEDDDGNHVPPWDILVPAIQTRNPELISSIIMKKEAGELVPCNPIEAIASAIRYAIVAAPGKLLMAGDFATIEARIVLALAGQHDRLALVKQGLDMYCDFATLVLGQKITKAENPKERQKYGKPGVLGCGFQQGARSFHAKYMRREPFSMAERCVDIYRKDWAPLVPKLWYGLEEAALRAVWDRVPSSFAGVEYRIEDQWLTARLPSNRKLYYFNPRQCTKAMPWDPDDIRPGWQYTAKKQGRIVTVDAYGGLLTENAVQGLARDVLYDRVPVLEEYGLPPVLTVHDEGVTEVDEDKADIKLMQEIMEDVPHWVKELGVPIEAECWAGERYRK